MAQRMRLGDMLLRAGLVNDLQLKSALSEQQRWGGRLGRILVQMNYISEDILVKALAHQMGVPVANVDAASVPPAVLQRVDRTVCEAHGVVPIAYISERRTLVVATSDPQNVAMVDELTRRAGVAIELQLSGEFAIARAIVRMFGDQSAPTETSADESSLKLINNQGSTLIKNVDEVRAEHRARADSTNELGEMRALADKQARAIRAVADLLIEKGVMSAADVRRSLNSQS